MTTPGCHLRFLHTGKGFTSEDLCAALEEDDIGYTLKLRITKGLRARIQRSVLWRRLPCADPTVVLEVGCVKLKATAWSKCRSVGIGVRFGPESTRLLCPLLTSAGPSDRLAAETPLPSG